MVQAERQSQQRTQERTTLQVRPAESTDKSTLMHFKLSHGRKEDLNPACEPFWTTGLDYLGGDLHDEYWQSKTPMVSGQHGNVIWQRSGGLLFMAYQRPDDCSEDVSEIACSSYRSMLNLAISKGHGWPVRAWNFMPSINVGMSDNERYRRFCHGRASALDSVGVYSHKLCAASAIGSHENLFRVYMLCSDSPVVNIDNPRQISAYKYPRQYGPRGPSFARATGLYNDRQGYLLMIAGTASIVGHATLHVGDVMLQLEETIQNIRSLLIASADKLGSVITTGCEFGNHTKLRVYVRHAGDWPMIEARLRKEWPRCRLAGLRGDICRAGLQVEIEAVTEV